MVSPRVTTDTFITDRGSKAGDFFSWPLSKTLRQIIARHVYISQ